MKVYSRLGVSGVHGSSPCLARHINPLKVRLFTVLFSPLDADWRLCVTGGHLG